MHQWICIRSGFYAFEEIFRAAEEELEQQKLMADEQLDVELKRAASKAFKEARLMVEDALTTPVPTVCRSTVHVNRTKTASR